jgi:hypothetical protein
VNIGEKYTLIWKAPHRIECEIVALEKDYVCAVAVHRCPPTCVILQMRQTIPIEGEMRFRYQDFASLFLPLNADAIAIGPAQ